MPGIDQRYLYIPEDAGESVYDQHFADLLQYQFRLETGYFRNDSWKRKFIKRFIGSRGPFFLRLAKMNIFHKAAVLKDPVACLSTSYLSKKMNAYPIVLLRHPIGFVASTKRLNWEIDLESITNQRSLMEKHFTVEELTPIDPKDNIEKAAILWRALNKVLLQQVSQNADWKLIKHEDLAADPIPTFKDLYTYAQLDWTPRIENYIKRKTNSEQQFAVNGRTQQFERDSTKIFQQSHNFLSKEEKELIHSITIGIAEPFYSSESFGLGDTGFNDQ